MMSPKQVLVVSAGLGQPSSTRLLADRLAEASGDAARHAGIAVDVHTVELRELAHPLLDRLLTGFASGPVADLHERLARADGLIAVTPLFTTTFSGLFKTFVDGIEPDAVRGLPVLLGATGGTPRHSLALEYSVRPLFTYLHAEPVTTSVFAATDDWAGTVDAVNPLPARIRRGGEELVARMLGTRTAEPIDPFVDGPSFESLLGGE